jgi:hypothetical protein
MKNLKLIILLFCPVFFSKSSCAQDVLLNILTQNSGLVNVKGTVFLEITVCNKSSTTAIPAYKLRPQISFPSQLVSIPDTGHVLPAGWAVISNEQGVVKLSNGTDLMPPASCRTILVAMKGIKPGGPSTISANLNFSNGVAPGAASGAATAGDNPADNASTTSIKVNSN